MLLKHHNFFGISSHKKEDDDQLIDQWLEIFSLYIFGADVVSISQQILEK